MAQAYPCLRIDSYDEAMPYYLDFLGFKVEFEYRHEEAFSCLHGYLKGRKLRHLARRVGSPPHRAYRATFSDRRNV